MPGWKGAQAVAGRGGEIGVARTRVPSAARVHASSALLSFMVPAVYDAGGLMLTVVRKLPSMPLTSMALIIMRVSRKGTWGAGEVHTCKGKRPDDHGQGLASTSITGASAYPPSPLALTSPLSRAVAAHLTFSGNFSRHMDASKQSPKSMCSSCGQQGGHEEVSGHSVWGSRQPITSNSSCSLK